MRLPLLKTLPTPKITTQKGAALVEYGILAGLVAVAAIAAVLLLGDTNRTAICLADATLADRVLGETVEPCVVRLSETLEGPAPLVPTLVPIAVPSELAGFLNPVGPIPVVQAVDDTTTPLAGRPDTDAIIDALCLFLGFEAPATGVTYADAAAATATFLPGGRLVWSNPDATVERWIYDTAAPAYTVVTSGPVIETLSCSETVLQ